VTNYHFKSTMSPCFVSEILHTYLTHFEYLIK